MPWVVSQQGTVFRQVRAHSPAVKQLSTYRLASEPMRLALCIRFWPLRIAYQSIPYRNSAFLYLNLAIRLTSIWAVAVYVNKTTEDENFHTSNMRYATFSGRSHATFLFFCIIASHMFTPILWVKTFVPPGWSSLCLSFDSKCVLWK